MPSSRLYLDNAATSFPKPAAVYEAMFRYATEIGATPGRANYAESREGGRLIFQCRERLNTLINGESAHHIVFTLNTTDALNLAIKGLVRHARRTRPGRAVHLVTTELDHNSVLRPFNALADEGVEWTCVPCDAEDGVVDPGLIYRAIRAETVLVAVVHASNVTGTIQRASEIGAVCRETGVPFLLDAAQTLGHIGVDVRELNVDLLAFPGHKGLLGPLGTGGLYIRPGLERSLDTVREGGTGTVSELDRQPDVMPDKYEPGSHNALGIVGLSEAVAYLLSEVVPGGFEHERALIRTMLGHLAHPRLEDFRLLGTTDAGRRVGVFSLVHPSLGPRQVADLLESKFGILARSGLHCAPRAHAACGTLNGSVQTRGALRVSFGSFVTIADVDRLADALAAIAAGAPAAQRASL